MVETANQKRPQKFLSIKQDGLIPREELEHLTFQDWELWLLDRSTSHDFFTGQSLTGVANPYALVRDSIIPLDISETTEKFADAALHLIRRLIYSIKPTERNANPDVIEQNAHTLSNLLELLATLPSRIIRQSKNLEPRLIDIYKELIEDMGFSLPDTVYPRLIQSAMRFLSAFAFPFRRSDLLRLLETPYAAREALHLLTNLNPLEHGKYFEQFVKFCANTNRLILVNVEVGTLRADLKDDEIRGLISAVGESLDWDTREELMNLPTIRDLFANSPTLISLRERGVMHFNYKGYLEHDEKNAIAPPSWALSLLLSLKDKASVLTARKLDYRPSPGAITWEDEARAAAEGDIALDPIYLSPNRSKFISIVPYGYVEELALVYISPPDQHELAGYLRDCISVEDSITLTSEIGVLAYTSATEELDEGIRKSKIINRPHPEIYLPPLLSWLEEDWKKRFLVLDIGFVPLLEKYYDTHTITRVADLERHKYGRLSLRSHNVKYRKPVLVGVPFALGDRVWAERVREAVDEIIFDKLNINSLNSELNKLMINAGIIPLTEVALNTQSFWKQIDEFYYPHQVIPAKHGVGNHRIRKID